MSRTQSVPTLHSLPRSLSQDGAISIKLEEGVPVLRASRSTRKRIEELVQKQKISTLTPDEEEELQQYEDVDDYLSYLNRLTRNLAAVSEIKEDRVA